MDELSGGKAKELKSVRAQSFPYSRASFVKLVAEFALGLFKIELFERRFRCKRIKEVAVEGKSDRFVYIFIVVRISRNEGVERREHVCGEYYRARVDIDRAALVYSTVCAQRFNRLLMQEFRYPAVFAVQENTVVLARFNVLFEGDSRSTVAAVVYLQGVEQKKHVARKQEHTLAYSGGNARHGNHKFIEKCCGSAVGKLVRNGRKELAESRILRYSLGVAARVYNEYAKPGEIVFARVLRYVFDNAERRATAADSLAVPVGDNGKMRVARQKACLFALRYLSLEALRLLGIRGGEHYVIPAREVIACERAFVVVPCVRVGLGEE